MNYESVIVFGHFVEIDRHEERLAALQGFTEKLLPGRWAEVRQPTRKELKATSVFRMVIEEASANLTAFFDRYLHGSVQPVLRKPSTSYPALQRLH